MATNKIVYLVIGALVLVLFIRKPAEIDMGVQDKGVTFRVLTYDENKQLIGELKMGKPILAIVTFPGGIPQGNSHFIRLESTISITAGNVPVSITDITADNTGTNVYELAIAGYDKQFTLEPGDPPNVQVSDFMELAELSGDVEFRLDVMANYLTAVGEEIGISTFGTIIVNVQHEVCTDGTLNGECSIMNRGMYCFNGDLVPRIEDCGCCLGEPIPCGWEQRPGTDECYDELCGDGTHAGECISENTHFPMFCELDGTQTDACERCGCGNDIYGNPSIGCSMENDPSMCEYQKYSSSISVELGRKGLGPK
jgi:hypothetical protein